MSAAFATAQETAKSLQSASANRNPEIVRLAKALDAVCTEVTKLRGELKDANDAIADLKQRTPVRTARGR